jgi:two-component system KDP operon response regulator KdpE
VRNAGKVLTHHALLGAVWGGDYTQQHEYLRVFIGQLRKKIEPDPSHPRFILTEPWIGYRFIPE